jgi:uncharacterized protein (UPF0276 family)
MSVFVHDAQPRVGLAHGPGVTDWLATHRGLIDYIEIPFEQLRHAPRLAALREQAPLVLHCASLSIAGFVAPTDETVYAIAAQAISTATPWIGEHLAFVAADAPTDEPGATPTALTYTVCPQLSEEVVERVAANLDRLRPRLPVPLILENSPQYFVVPGSTMRMSEFIAAVAERCDIDLLLDLSHFVIGALNMDLDPIAELERLPLERVVEVHVSGMKRQSGILWDDHATPATPQVFELLARLMRRARPRALTLEYNWSAHFPSALVREHLCRAREAIGAT